MNDLLIQWHILTIGCLSRNRFWGEDEGQAYRRPVCTSVLLNAGGKKIVVDPSLPSEEMAKVLDARCGMTPDEVDLVYLTHFHGDHYVGLEAFEKAAWLMAPGEFRSLKSVKGNREQQQLQRISPADPILVPGIELIHLPGHTHGLTGLIFRAVEGRVVLAADSVMTKDYFQAKQGYFNNVDLEATMRSIERIAEIADVVIPGHDNYFIVKNQPF